MLTEKQKKMLSIAYDILARRSYVMKEMRNKLKTKCGKSNLGCEEKDIDIVIKSLLTSGFLDDENYTDLFISSELRKRPQGKRLLFQKLKKKGVDDDLIKRRLNLVEIDERLLIENLIKTRHKKNSLSKKNNKAKLVALNRFLYSRGFDASIICDCITKKFNM